MQLCGFYLPLTDLRCRPRAPRLGRLDLASSAGLSLTRADRRDHLRGSPERDAQDVLLAHVWVHACVPVQVVVRPELQAVPRLSRAQRDDELLVGLACSREGSFTFLDSA